MMLGWVDVGSVVVEEIGDSGISDCGVEGCVGVCITLLLRLMNEDRVLGGSTLSGWKTGEGLMAGSYR